MSALLAAAAQDGIFKETPLTEPVVTPPVETPPSNPTPEVPAKQVEEPAKQPDPTPEKPKQEGKKTLTKADGKPWEQLAPPKKPEAAKAPESVEGEDDTPPAPEGTNEKGKITWKELHKAKKERDAFQAQITELNKKLETASPAKTEEITKEIEAIRKERDELSQLVAERRLERSDEFKKAVVEPLATANTQIEKLIKMGGLDKAEMEKAVGLTDEVERAAAIEEVISAAAKRIQAATEDGETVDGKPLNAILQSQLHKAVDKLHAAWGEEDRLRAQARDIEGAANSKEESARANAEKQAAKEWSEAHETMRMELASKLTDVFGDPDLAKQAVEAAVKPATPIDAAYQAFSGALLPHYVQRTNEQAARIAELEAQVGDRAASKPSISGEPEAPKKTGQNMTLREAMVLQGVV